MSIIFLAEVEVGSTTVKSAYLCLSSWKSPILVSEAQNYQVLSKRQIIESNLEISPPLCQWYLGESQTNIKFCGTSHTLTHFSFTEKRGYLAGSYQLPFSELKQLFSDQSDQKSTSSWSLWVHFYRPVVWPVGANLVCSQNSNQEFIVQVMSLSSQNSPLPNLHHPTLVLAYLTKDQPLYL